MREGVDSRYPKNLWLLWCTFARPVDSKVCVIFGEALWIELSLTTDVQLRSRC